MKKSFFAIAAFAALSMFAAPAEAQSQFIRGDVNKTGTIDLADVIEALGALFAGGTVKCLDAVDFDDSGVLGLGDVVGLLGFLFVGGAAPAEPFTDFELDPTVDGIGCSPVVNVGSITISTDTTWTNDSTWVIGDVFVANGATLTVEAGTTVVGSGLEAGFLCILPGGGLNAVGDVNRPIVFTSDDEAGSRSIGSWGGVIIIGNDDVNFPGGNSTIEGLDNETVEFGQTASTTTIVNGIDAGFDALNADINIQNVRIEWGGTEIGPGNEINGLTLGGIGEAAIIENIMVKYNLDDGIEFFGGSVGVRNAYVFGCADDSIDASFGWVGAVQRAVIHQNQEDADNGFEFNNGEIPAVPQDAMPFTTGLVANFTVVGGASHTDAALGALNGESDNGILCREGNTSTWRNGIIQQTNDELIQVNDAITLSNANGLGGTGPVFEDIALWNAPSAGFTPALFGSLAASDAGLNATLVANTLELTSNPLTDSVFGTNPSYTPVDGVLLGMGTAGNPGAGFTLTPGQQIGTLTAIENLSFYGAIDPDGTDPSTLSFNDFTKNQVNSQLVD